MFPLALFDGVFFFFLLVLDFSDDIPVGGVILIRESISDLDDFTLELNALAAMAIILIEISVPTHVRLEEPGCERSRGRAVMGRGQSKLKRCGGRGVCVFVCVWGVGVGGHGERILMRWEKKMSSDRHNRD